MANKFANEPVGCDFRGASVEPQELMALKPEGFREDKEGIIMGVDARSRDGFDELLGRVSRELFGEVCEGEFLGLRALSPGPSSSWISLRALQAQVSWISPESLEPQWGQDPSPSIGPPCRTAAAWLQTKGP